MLTVKLFTKSGGFVHEAMVPPFLTPPDVLIWGSRVFIPPAVSDEVRLLELAAGSLAYVEAFAYFIPPEASWQSVKSSE